MFGSRGLLVSLLLVLAACGGAAAVSAPASGGASGFDGATGTGGAAEVPTGGTTPLPGTGGRTGGAGVGGALAEGGRVTASTGGSRGEGGRSEGGRALGGAAGGGGLGGSAHAGAGGAPSAGCTVAPGLRLGRFVDPVAATDIAPPNPPGMVLKDADGKPLNAHGGGIIRVCDTFYLHGEYFPSNETANDFNGFTMYSSGDLATWKNEGIILPQQPSGELGPHRKGERPHIIRCPATGEFVLYAHAADSTYQVDKEVVYATASVVTGPYVYRGPLKNASGTLIAHSDMSAFTDGNNAYVLTESGGVYTLGADCHAWTSTKTYGAINGTTGGAESPTVFRAGDTFYWIGSDKTGWRANDNFYSTAPSMAGPWTYQGYLAPKGKLTWMTQSTWVLPVTGSQGTVYLFWGDHWYGNQDTSAPGKHNDLATYVFQPLVFNGAAVSLPSYQASWKLDVGAGTWSN